MLPGGGGRDTRTSQVSGVQGGKGQVSGGGGVAAVQAAEQGGKDSKAERKLVEWALAGEGQKPTMEFLRVMMRKRKQILE